MAEYQGKKVKLNAPRRLRKGEPSSDKKKSVVYVRSETGRVKRVTFGDPNLSIKKDQPGRKKNYCARSSGQGNLTKKTSANYWSRRAWDC
jgi:hypothetical protein